MVDLHVRAVQWCAHHGHPILILDMANDRSFVVAITAQDAAELAMHPDANEVESPSHRLYQLLEASLRAVGSGIAEVHLHVGHDHHLRSSLRLRTPGGEADLPAHFADGIVLAHRNGISIRMSESNLARVPLAPLAPTTPNAPPAALPDAFQSFIESLDFDAMDYGHGEGGPAPTAPRR